MAIPPNLLEDTQYSYYRGQRVQVKMANAPRSTKWLCGNWRENQVVGTVCAVEAGLVYVYWVASIVMGGDRNLTAPQALQNPEDLTLLPCVSHASWQLGDWCILPDSSHCDIAELQTPNVVAYNLNECHKTFQKGFSRNMQNSGLEELFVITKTKMKVDVMWQDGSYSLGVDSQQLLPVGAVNNAHDFWVEQFVVKKETCNSKKWGVVKAVNAKEQTVKVQWRTQVEKEQHIVLVSRWRKLSVLMNCLSILILDSVSAMWWSGYFQKEKLIQMQTQSLLQRQNTYLQRVTTVVRIVCQVLVL